MEQTGAATSGGPGAGFRAGRGCCAERRCAARVPGERGAGAGIGARRRGAATVPSSMPLLVALRARPDGSLIADDVGIEQDNRGAHVARAPVPDRGEAERLAVLCLPQLAEQWQQEPRRSSTWRRSYAGEHTAAPADATPTGAVAVRPVPVRRHVDRLGAEFDRRRDEGVGLSGAGDGDEEHACMSASAAARGAGGTASVAGRATDAAGATDSMTATPHSGNKNSGAAAAARSALAREAAGKWGERRTSEEAAAGGGAHWSLPSGGGATSSTTWTRTRIARHATRWRRRTS